MPRIGRFSQLASILDAGLLPAGAGDEDAIGVDNRIGYTKNLIQTIHQRLETSDIDKFGVLDNLIGHQIV